MKSTLINMTAVLLGITLVGSAGVGIVNMITTEPIAAADRNSARTLVEEVLPEGVEILPADTLLNIKGNIVLVSKGMLDGQIAGYAIAAPSLTKKGFNGTVSLMVGFNPDGTIYNIRVLKQNETPGLGTVMAVEGNKLYHSFFDRASGAGKNPGQMKLAVTKDNGEVDALTAATISSRAYVNAVATAYAAFLQASSQSGASLEELSAGQAAGEQESTEGLNAQKGAENE